MSSIKAKLRRFENMNLARMQDIGGLRAVVPTIRDVNQLVANYKSSQFKHELASEKDYIANPKNDGYRGVHLVYKYNSYLDASKEYNGLNVELQIRTQLQHTWATGVETMGTFLNQALKSNQGEVEWLKFFEITGSAFAFLENCPLVPGYTTLTREETFAKVAEAEKQLGVLKKIRGFTVASQQITNDRGSYHLIVLDTAASTVTVHGYAQKDLKRASEDYTKAESVAKADKTKEVVLVSAGRVNELRKAYPNYFLDTADFVQKVIEIIRESSRRRPAGHGQPRAQSQVAAP